MNPNKYFIRTADKQAVTEETDLPTVAHLIDQGKLRFVYKKFRKKKYTTQFADHSETEIVMETHRFYDRTPNGTPTAREICTKPCCTYGGTGR